MNRGAIKKLNGRQAQVMLALAAGGTIGSVASDLGITARTVSAHIAAIYKLLAIKTHAEIGAVVGEYRPLVVARAVDGKPATNRKEAANA